MIQIAQLKFRPDHKKKDLKNRAVKLLKLPYEKVKTVTVYKRSIDARKKPDVYYIYTLLVETVLSEAEEQKLVKKLKQSSITMGVLPVYQFPPMGKEKLTERPVVIGMGPAGLFCAYMLAKKGYKPIVIERGQAVEKRTATVESYWNGGKLDPESNVQFGEGGAGTFSDGKLNTMVKDPDGRGREVLSIFCRHGAPEDIMYVNKPHIGTDVLRKVVSRMRNEIITLGGEVRFRTRVIGLYETNGHLTGLKLLNHDGTRSVLSTTVAVLAIGHSARDTFEMLHDFGIRMEQKSFAVGFRIEHPQSMINYSQYAIENPKDLPVADYKLTHRAENGRGVYSFCMCPGGHVVNSSSEEERICVNGMSYRARDSKNANSALIVTVTPEDYPGEDALAGVRFQREIEHRAYLAGQGMIPSQLYGDFKENKPSVAYGEVVPEHKGLTKLSNLRGILPSELEDALVEGIEAFDRKIKGFSRADAILSGVEGRTSSPVKIIRDENMESESLKGLYPCGEGPGYAGGITSAAMDGLRAAETIASRYRSFSV